MNLTISTSKPIISMNKITFKADKGGDNHVRKNTISNESNNTDTNKIPYDSHLHDSPNSYSDKAASFFGYSIITAMAIAGFMTNSNDNNKTTNIPQDIVSTEMPNVLPNITTRFDSIYKKSTKVMPDGTIVTDFPDKKNVHERPVIKTEEDDDNEE